jgi:hypothetical protein
MNMEKRLKMNEQFRLSTPDLYFAAYLKAKACQIIEIQREGTKTIFVFDVTDSKLSVTELKNGYFNQNDDNNEKFATVAITFADAIRALKTLCHVDEENNKIVTPDLYFAAYLKTKKCMIESIKHRDSKTVFIFDPATSNLSIIELKLGYFNNIFDKRCVVNASNYTDAVRSLKTMCHITSD